MSNNDNKLKLARELFTVKQQLDVLKVEEMSLRKQTVEAFFGEKPEKGTSREELNENMELVLVQSAKISIDKEAFDKHKAHMESKGLIGDEAVIRMKPDVSATAYKYMSDADKILFADVFKHGFNSPTLTFEAKKTK